MPIHDDDSDEITRLVTDGAGHPVRLEVQRASVTPLGGDGRSAVDVSKGAFSLGKGEANDLVLQDETVSRCHATIRVEAKGFVLRDEGSRNGTFVDGVPIREAFLLDGATLRLGAAELRFELNRERQTLELSQREQLGALIGASAPMRRAYTLIERYAELPYEVVITGETGTGKELAARALHDEGPQRDGPFVTVDCTLLLKDRMEADLFGWRRGAFTGATQDQDGFVSRAHGGTLFIDEIGDLPLPLQAKLLRVVQEKTYQPLGSAQVKRSNFRLIAATRRDLRQSVNEGSFREDLLYRLQVLPLHLPPLRAREGDVALLMNHFIRQELKALRRPLRSFPPLSSEAMQALNAHGWPGNVRQLRGFVRRLVALSGTGGGDAFGPEGIREALETLEVAEDSTPDPASFIEEILESLPGKGNQFQAGKRRVVDAYEVAFVHHILERANMSVPDAAEGAGMYRQELNRIMRRQGIQLSDLKR